MHRISFFWLLLAQAAQLAVASCGSEVANPLESGILQIPAKENNYKRVISPDSGNMCRHNMTLVKAQPCEISCYFVEGESNQEQYGCYKCPDEPCPSGGCPSPAMGSCTAGNFNRKRGLQDIYMLTWSTMSHMSDNLRVTMRDDLCKLFQEETKCGKPCDKAHTDKLKADFEIEKTRMLALHERIRPKQYGYDTGSCSCRKQGSATWSPPWVDFAKIPKPKTDGSGNYDGWPTLATKDADLRKALKDAGSNWKTFYKGPYHEYGGCNLECGGGGGTDTTSAATGLVMSLGLLVLPFVSF